MATGNRQPTTFAAKFATIGKQMQRALPTWLMLLFCWALVAQPLFGCGQRSTAKGKKDDAAKDSAKTAPRTRALTSPMQTLMWSDSRKLPELQKFRLLDRGSAPRVKRRYRTKALDNTKLWITSRDLKTRTATTDWNTLPDFRLGIGLHGSSETAKATDNGRVRAINFLGLRAEILGKDKTSPQAQTALWHYKNFVERRRGQVDVSDRGIVGDVTLLTPDKSKDRHTKRAIQKLLIQSVVPWPQEAIGVGARWEVVTSLYNGRAIVKQKANYTLSAIDDGLHSIAVHIKQIGEVQTIHPADLPKGFQHGKLIALVWELKGELKVDTNSPMPRAGIGQVNRSTHAEYLVSGARKAQFSESSSKIEFNSIR